jgi:hypothetical protein
MQLFVRMHKTTPNPLFRKKAEQAGEGEWEIVAEMKVIKFEK